MKIKKKHIKLDWYQDGNFSGKNSKDASIEQFVVTFDKAINPKKGTLKIIVPDKTKNDPYGKDKLGEIEVKMDGTSTKTLVPTGDGVTCMIKPDHPIKSDKRFILELTQDWDCILNSEKTGIHYYDERVKGLKLIGEGLEDENGNIIEDSKGSGKIVSDRYIELKKDTTKPFIVGQKLIYDKIGMNGVQKAGSLGIVFNEPVQLYTKKMVKQGVIGPIIYKDHNPLTPNPTQIGTYDNFLPELKVYYEKLNGNGNPTIIDATYELMSDILSSDEKVNKTLESVSIKMNEIPYKFDLDPSTSGINRFRDYGLFYINPKVGLSEGKWRVVISGISDDAGNEMDEYKSKPFEIKPLFNVQSLTKDKLKIKFTEPFKERFIGGNSLVLVVTQYGEIVNSVLLEDLKDGQTEVEAEFDKPIEDFEGEYSINNISYKV